MDLLTPTRPAPASKAPAAPHAVAGARLREQGQLRPARKMQQPKPALAGSPDVDLTQDSD